MGRGVGIERLEGIAKESRRNILKMIFEAGSGHPGGSLSEIDILTALYFRVMQVDPENPGWAGRDRFILSKAHACPGLYATLAARGYFPEEGVVDFSEDQQSFAGACARDDAGRGDERWVRWGRGCLSAWAAHCRPGWTA